MSTGEIFSILTALTGAVIIGNYISKKLFESENELAQQIIYRQFLKDKIRIKVVNLNNDEEEEPEDDDTIDIEVVKPQGGFTE